MQTNTASAISFALICMVMITGAADEPRAYLLNEDSHPHEILPGTAARFTVEQPDQVGLVDIKCSLEGDAGHAITQVMLRSEGLTDLHWPFATRSIRVDHKINFDIRARTRPDYDGIPWFEIINQDPVRLLWHQCYNN